MKKLLFIPILFLTIFVYMNNVKADTLSFSDFYYNYSEMETIYSSRSSNIEHLISLWETNYKSQYPYYYINYVKDNVSSLPQECQDDATMCDINLFYSSSPYISFSDMNGLASASSPYKISSGNILTGWTGNTNQHFLHINYNPRNNTYSDYNASTSYNDIPYVNPSYIISPYHLIALASNGYMYKSDDNISSMSNYTSIVTPSYSFGSTSYSSFEILNGSLLPDFNSLSSGTYDPSNSPNFTEINLNNYSYVILSLKDYSLRNDNNNQFSTPIYTLGSLCITPVYNYGMKEKKDYYSGYNVQACSSTYTSLTPVDVYVLKNDLINHSVYYIKAYDDNSTIIKVDNTIFDITYITSSNENNPSVTINGRSYPTIPFNQLTQSANKSSDEGYISGQVCAIGDINCQAKANGLDISNLFTHPLQLLETLWGSITAVFSTITTFITILPPTLQTFLYVSFMLIVILGILKYLL